MPSCAAVNCTNRTEKKFRLFRFPSDPERRAKWIQNMRRDKFIPSTYACLCEKHFEDSQYEQNRADGWKKLKPNAVPTLFDVPNPPPKIDAPQRRSVYKRKKLHAIQSISSEDKELESVYNAVGKDFHKKRDCLDQNSENVTNRVDQVVEGENNELYENWDLAYTVTEDVALDKNNQNTRFEHAEQQILQENFNLKTDLQDKTKLVDQLRSKLKEIKLGKIHVNKPCQKFIYQGEVYEVQEQLGRFFTTTELLEDLTQDTAHNNIMVIEKTMNLENLRADRGEFISRMPNFKLEMPEYLEQDDYDEQNLGTFRTDGNGFEATENEEKMDISQTFYSPIQTAEQNSKSILETNSASSRLKNEVYQMLMESYEGDFMIACYDYESVEENRNKLLDKNGTTYFSKNKVAKLIINSEFQRTNEYTISSDRLEELASFASELFPSIIKESFYTKRTTSKCAGGVFQTYYTKQREKEFNIGRIRNSKKRKLPDSEESDQFGELTKVVEVIDYNYRKMWSTTDLQKRINFYEKSDIKTIFSTLVNLSHPKGYMLIQSDFSTFFDKPSNLFLKNWSHLSDGILKVAKYKAILDKEVKEILKINAPISTSEHKKTLALMLLPYLFKRMVKISARSKAKQPWNPTKEEISKTFINHIKETENLDAALKQCQDDVDELHRAHQLTVQPYVIICGPNLSKITSAFVILGDLKYQLDTPLQAVDICFQSMQVLKKDYPLACNHIWQFLEKRFYMFDVQNPYTGVISLIERLNAAERSL